MQRRENLVSDQYRGQGNYQPLVQTTNSSLYQNVHRFSSPQARIHVTNAPYQESSRIVLSNASFHQQQPRGTPSTVRPLVLSGTKQAPASGYLNSSRSYLEQSGERFQTQPVRTGLVQSIKSSRVYTQAPVRRTEVVSLKNQPERNLYSPRSVHEDPNQDLTQILNYLQSFGGDRSRFDPNDFENYKRRVLKDSRKENDISDVKRGQATPRGILTVTLL